ncbi:tRNA pseudouridine13 synthase [Steroidobacter denitrificans]|uniref:tRNA pseudouridine synthase D n=1 Tax=Steroidobacter denitrificans TaxID=465721 RepID=A0A127FA80_STEDE|nr:tRNA pseudouridine(13) synthase TruD [Steroidobacter denitrificans]AMN47324.1 tRNA pseudouridine13 synthase [Steroidobacter denitrificans]
MIEPESLSHLPRAHGGPAGRARLRTVPEDFVVREWLGFEADGEGDHLLLKLRKRGANTLWVAKQLARIAKIHVRDVGFAGLKDRDAVAEQSFTVPARSAIGRDDIQEWLAVSGEGFEVIAVARQRRKLRRGALRGNEFEILVRDFAGDAALLEARLRTIALEGIPNYFGPQRFGHAGQNLKLAQAWFAGEAVPRDRTQRGFALSAARAAIFNAVLAQRVAEGSWNRLCDGDIAGLDGSASIFAVPVVDEVLRERCRQLDIHPTGPLWGAERGAPEPMPSLERQVAALYPILAQGLAREGMEAQRRTLRARVGELTWSITAARCDTAGDPAADMQVTDTQTTKTQIRLAFRLPRGAFATAVMHELLDNAFIQDMPEDQE